MTQISAARNKVQTYMCVRTYAGTERPSTSTSPTGAVTHYTYVDTVPQSKTATNCPGGWSGSTCPGSTHWVTTTFDGFGRTVQTATGHDSTTVSLVTTNYVPCGCSPVGKMGSVSEPYAPGGTPVYTTYHYDGQGRTTSVVTTDGSVTSYSYSGNTVTVTDPSGRWKTFTMDALGNLTQVSEPSAPTGSTPSNGLPVFSPAPGGYTTAQTVTITSSTIGGSIRYTTDGTTPSEKTGRMSGGKSAVNATATLKAIAYGGGVLDSTVASAAYTIGGGGSSQVIAVALNPAPGVYSLGQLIGMSTTTAGATIRYTTDGSTPSETNGTVYVGPIAFGANVTINAIAYKSGLSDSPITSGPYTIQNSWGGTPNVTTYTYDMLNHLTGVSMPRSTGTQTRTFNYTSGTTVGALLLSATNPENGTVTYTYDSQMRLSTKTDAKGQVFTYTYDGYNRLAQISVGGTVLRTYVYDTNADDATYSQYAAGRLAEVKYPTIGTFPDGAGHNITTTLTDMFSYTPAGQVAGKRLRVKKTSNLQAGSGDLNLVYAYNSEGKLTSVTYPTDANGSTPTFTYTYDAMMRLATMTDQSNYTQPVVNGVQYNAANQVTAMNYYGFAETRAYNNLMQLSNITATAPGQTGINVTYNYTPGGNSGKITSATDALSGETVTYQYDALNRLISAQGNGWAQTQAYDGFGNLTARTGYGTAQGTTISTAVDAATNRLSGYAYDANGNQISSGYGYDAENRIVSANAGGVEYSYDAQNKRVWQGNFTSGFLASETVTLFGADGKMIATYGPGLVGTAVSFNAGPARIYFGGKLVASQGQAGQPSVAVVQDRLGSVGKYYPYGEMRDQPNDGMFATYTRDAATGNDYADQRYYSSALGRFMTPDPYKASAGPADPGSWNPYVYTRSDPVNRFDPRGLCDQSGDTDYSVTVCGGGGDPFVGDVADPQAGSSSTHADTDPVDPVTRFHELNDDCQNGLKTAMYGPDSRGADNARLGALAQAERYKGVLQKAADKYGIDWSWLAAIAIRESGFSNEKQKGGQAVGVFQIDPSQNPSVSTVQAKDIAWAADWVAGYLQKNEIRLANDIPNLSPNDLTRAVLASYNAGLGGVESVLKAGLGVDSRTTGFNYGWNVFDLTTCF